MNESSVDGYPRSSSAAFCGQSVETMDDDVVSHRHRTKGTQRTSPFVAAAAAVTRDWEGRRRVKDFNSFFCLLRVARLLAFSVRIIRTTMTDGCLIALLPIYTFVLISKWSRRLSTAARSFVTLRRSICDGGL